ncbi:DUF1775 domain-containing protein [Krasilnikovia sp. M28-CT-15]|uniref:DUF1775 domain-containing protein n=1 Tax=Krasilnikovia sp. M28-CT-15 TaxID=3373540 RepID=UPI00399CB308
MAGVAVLGVAGPALAHVEVSADKKQAGATDVTLTFSGEAESSKAGIISERVVLPQGIAPADVSLVKAPSGWTYKATADGFTVGGKALPVGKDAEWKVKIAKLPDGETRLSFRTLESYSDGSVDRWIEIQEPGEEEPEHPAPLVTLQPAPKSATSSAAPSPAGSGPASATPGAPAASAPAASAPVASAPASAGVSSAPAEASPAGRSNSTWWIWPALFVAVLVAAGAVFAYRRRGDAS